MGIETILCRTSNKRRDADRHLKIQTERGQQLIMISSKSLVYRLIAAESPLAFSSFLVNVVPCLELFNMSKGSQPIMIVLFPL